MKVGDKVSYIGVNKRFQRQWAQHGPYGEISEIRHGGAPWDWIEVRMGDDYYNSYQRCELAVENPLVWKLNSHWMR